MTERSHDRLPITAVVLAGGRSMRMGVDKTLLAVDGRTLVSRVCDAVAEICSDTVVVTNRPDALADADLPAGVEVLRDEIAYHGPLGGLVTAMAAARTEWVFAIAADTPHLEPAIVRSLWDAREGVDVVIPVGEKGLEPLLALYRVPACLEPARAVIATGRRRVVAMLSAVRVAEVPVDALRSADPDLRSLINVNTPTDLVDARDADAHVTEMPQTRVRCSIKPRKSMPSELPITIDLNGVEVATIQATPRDLEELAVGFLVAEGVLTDREALSSIDSDAKRGFVWVNTAEKVATDFADRARYITSGCGKGVTFASLKDAYGLARVESNLTVTADELYAHVGAMARAAEAYRDTGGMHACGLARAGSFAFVREDVGRHNAVDKVLGRAWLDGLSTDDVVLIVTGRISYEMAVKAARARVPIVVSRSAVTDLAADVAEMVGTTLVGYARGGRLTVYTHPERVECDTSQEESDD